MPFRRLSNLALDAPLVATSWWLLFSVSFDQRIDWLIPAALFPGVWAIYLFDRLYDTKSPGRIPPERKRFALAHPAMLKILLGCSVIWSVGVGVFILEKVWLQGIVIGLVTFGYFLFCRWKGKALNFPVKESLIGLCFAAGIGVPFEIPVSEKEIAALVIFGVLCCLNCLLISKAESEYDRDADPSAWFAVEDRDIPFTPILVLLLIAIGVLVGLGIALPIGLALLGACLFMMRLSQSSIQDMQSLSDAALWVPGVIFAMWALILGR